MSLFYVTIVVCNSSLHGVIALFGFPIEVMISQIAKKSFINLI